MTTITTYNSASKGTMKIADMPTPHLQNAVSKVRTAGGQADLLAALETELNTRTDRTDVETAAA